jgi:hypothetical protein
MKTYLYEILDENTGDFYMAIETKPEWTIRFRLPKHWKPDRKMCTKNLIKEYETVEEAQEILDYLIDDLHDLPICKNEYKAVLDFEKYIKSHHKRSEAAKARWEKERNKNK